MSVRQALFVVLLLIPTVVVRTQNASFSSKTEAVRVDVLVTDKGQPLLGLVPATSRCATTVCRNRSIW